MAKNSRAIGVANELAVAKLLEEHGFEARRGQQFKGTDESPDVIHNLAGFFIEVKKREQFTPNQMHDALDKAQAEAAEGDDAIVFYKKNRKPWLVTMDAHRFLTLMQEIYE